MSGTPSEAEIQAQWVAAVDILETLRALYDGTIMPAGGNFDVLIQALEGQYTPAGLTSAIERTRSLLASAIDSGAALAYLTPIIYEYGNILGASAGGGFGSGYTDVRQLFRALYEWFHATGVTVQSRALTYGTMGRSAFGNGVCSRLTVDELGYNLEACHVEKKLLRCRNDQYSGAAKWAERFEMLGEAASSDALLRAAFGSGQLANRALDSRHGGSGAGGSLLTNSSFSQFASSAFTGWTETTATGNIAQDTTNIYNEAPGTSTNGALRINSGATVTMKQTLAQMRTRRLDLNVPYFARVMVNKTVGSGLGGNVVLRLGTNSKTVAVSALSAGWNEVVLDFDEDLWPRNFVEDPLDFEIEWTSPSSGYLLFDDAILTPWDLVDGTYWLIRTNNASPVAWQTNDLMTFTDTGGAPATGKIQWWCFVAGLGYLPSDVTPSFADPA